jgi:hypothetical protein
MCVSKLLSPSFADPITKPRKANTAPHAEANEPSGAPNRRVRTAGKAAGASGATVVEVLGPVEVGASTRIVF